MPCGPQTMYSTYRNCCPNLSQLPLPPPFSFFSSAKTAIGLTPKFSTAPFRKYIGVCTESISWQTGDFLGIMLPPPLPTCPFSSLYFLLLVRWMAIISLLLLLFHRLSQMSSESDLEFRPIITLDQLQEFVNKSVVAAMVARALSFCSSEGGQRLWLFSKILHLLQSFSHLILKDPRLSHSSLA